MPFAHICQIVFVLSCLVAVVIWAWVCGPELDRMEDEGEL